jgi:hypothetical protein
MCAENVDGAALLGTGDKSVVILFVAGIMAPFYVSPSISRLQLLTVGPGITMSKLL